MSTLHQRALKSSAEYALALLKGIKDGEEDYETLRGSYDSALDNRRQLFGEALFLDLASITEIVSSEGDLSEDETFELERFVEMINLATFAFHVFYTMEIQTCLCAFFRTFKPLSDEYGPAEIDMYKILRMALFRQRFNASNNIVHDIGDIIDRTFPAEAAEDFNTYYLRADDPHNEHTIEWLMELRNKVLSMLPVEELDPEEFADEEEIRENLKHFIEHRYRWYEPEDDSPNENQQEPEETTSDNNYETYYSDEDQSVQELILPPRSYRSQTDGGEPSRKRLARSPRSDRSQTSDEDEDEDKEPPQKRLAISPPSDWSQSPDQDEEEQPHLESPRSYRSQTPDEGNQPGHRSIFSPHPNARVLSPVEAGFDEDIARPINDEEEIDELAEESSISNASPSPNTRYLSYEICQGTQTSPSLLPLLSPSSERSRRTLPNVRNTATSSTSRETITQRTEEITMNSVSSNPTTIPQRNQANHNNNRPTQSSSRSHNAPPPVRRREVAESSRSAVPQIPNDIDPAELPDDMFVNAGGRIQRIPTVRKPSVYWTDEETDALEEGLRKYGRQWVRIKKEYPVLNSRDPGQLKDKAVNVYKKRDRLNQDFGGFKCMGNPDR